MGFTLLDKDGNPLKIGGKDNFWALNANMKPVEYDTGGHYKLSLVTGTLAAALAANAQIFQFKNTSASMTAMLLSLRAKFMPLTPFTAATLTDHTSFDAVVARSYAAGGGGTTVTLTGNNAKVRSSMATCVSAINISATAALTLATTLDANPFAQSIRKGNRVNPAAATEEVIMPSFDGLTYEPDPARGEHPLLFVQNEGFVVRNRTVWPAAGTGIVMIDIHWVEFPNSTY